MLKMKNKKGVALLLILVVGIWGTITFKIVKQLYFPDGIEVPDPTVVPRSAKKSAAPLSYSFSYADPFLKAGEYRHQAMDAAPNTSFAIKEQPVAKQKPVVPAPASLRYLGWVSNSHRALKEGLVEQEGRVHILERGEEIDGYRLEQLFADSLVVSREGARFCLKREAGAH